MKLSNSILELSSLLLCGSQLALGAPAATSTSPGHVSASAASFPKPAVPIGAGGDPPAARAGRLFEIQAKLQYFAGKFLYLDTASMF